MNDPFNDFKDYAEEKIRTPFTVKPKNTGGFFKKLSRYLFLAVLVLLVLIGGSTSWYTVDDKQQAVVVFGNKGEALKS